MIAYPFHPDLIKQVLNYEWSPVAAELNSMVFKWVNVK
jgi:hypothetical protein